MALSRYHNSFKYGLPKSLLKTLSDSGYVVTRKELTETMSLLEWMIEVRNFQLWREKMNLIDVMNGAEFEAFGRLHRMQVEEDRADAKRQQEEDLVAEGVEELITKIMKEVGIERDEAIASIEGYLDYSERGTKCISASNAAKK